MLVLDFNGNGQIETRDILNLGGNVGQDGNQAVDALAATANAHLQRNNVEWLDANGDGVLDASDPAFAAVRLWVDANQDTRLETGDDCYAFDSGSRIFLKGQGPFLYTAANSPVWGICG